MRLFYFIYGPKLLRHVYENKTPAKLISIWFWDSRSYSTLRSRITHECTSTYFQWGHLVLLKGQQEETTVRYKESGCDILALFE